MNPGQYQGWPQWDNCFVSFVRMASVMRASKNHYKAFVNQQKYTDLASYLLYIVKYSLWFSLSNYECNTYDILHRPTYFLLPLRLTEVPVSEYNKLIQRTIFALSIIPSFLWDLNAWLMQAEVSCASKSAPIRTHLTVTFPYQ